MTNIVLNSGAGGATLGTDTVGGIDYQKVKVTYSADGSAPVSVDATHGLPNNLVQIAGTAVDVNSGGKSAGTQRMVIATDQPSLTNAIPVLQSGTWTVTVNGTVTANQGGAPWSENLTQVGGAAITLGAKTSANSIPVVLATDEAALPVSGTVTANAGTNLNTSALLLDATFTGRINTQGQKAMAASTPVVIASDQSAVPVSGTVTTVPPANASENLNQVGGAAITLGQKTMAASVPVVLASDESTLPISAASLPLPAGAATSALQSTINTTLGTPMQQTGGAVSVTNLPATQPVSAVALPLPANAAQETGGNIAAIAASEASIAALLAFMQQMVDLNTKMLAVMTATRLQQASAFNIDIEPDAVIPDPTFN